VRSHEKLNINNDDYGPVSLTSTNSSSGSVSSEIDTIELKALEDAAVCGSKYRDLRCSFSIKNDGQ